MAVRSLTIAEQAALELVRRHQSFTAPELAHIGGNKGGHKSMLKVLEQLQMKGYLKVGNARQCGITRKRLVTWKPEDLQK